MSDATSGLHAFDRNTLSDVSGPDIILNKTDTLPDLLARTAARYPDLPAIEYKRTLLSWKELAHQVDRMAAGLYKAGLRRGDFVLSVLPNSPETIILYHAVLRLGAAIVAAGPLLPVADLMRLMHMAPPRLMLGLDLKRDQLWRAGDRCIDVPSEAPYVWVSLRRHESMIHRFGYGAHLLKDNFRHLHEHHTHPNRRLSQLMSRARLQPQIEGPEPQDIALLQPTHGVGGGLKLAALSHTNLIANALQLGMHVPIEDGTQRVLGILPTWHAYGFYLGLVQPMISASCALPVSTPTLPRLMQVIHRRRPTMLPLVPALIAGICDRIERQGDEDLAIALQNTRVFSGAAPLPAALFERFERLTGVRIIEGYGCSEASPITHASLDGEGVADFIGPPVPGTRARIVAPDDPSQVLPFGEEGMLAVSGPQIFQGYLGNDEATAEVMWTDADGTVWLLPGDTGLMYANGYLRITKPRPRMVNRGGFKIWPNRVREALEALPEVLAARVWADPNRIYTQDIRAEVVLTTQTLDSLNNELTQIPRKLRRALHAHLAAYEIPRKIQLVESLPPQLPTTLPSQQEGGAA